MPPSTTIVMAVNSLAGSLAASTALAAISSGAPHPRGPLAAMVLVL